MHTCVSIPVAVQNCAMDEEEAVQAVYTSKNISTGMCKNRMIGQVACMPWAELVGQ